MTKFKKINRVGNLIDELSKLPRDMPVNATDLGLSVTWSICAFISELSGRHCIVIAPSVFFPEDNENMSIEEYLAKTTKTQPEEGDECDGFGQGGSR